MRGTLVAKALVKNIAEQHPWLLFLVYRVCIVVSEQILPQPYIGNRVNQTNYPILKVINKETEIYSKFTEKLWKLTNLHPLYFL